MTTELNIAPAVIAIFGDDFRYVDAQGRKKLLQYRPDFMARLRERTIEVSEKTYPVKEALLDNWFPFAWAGFKEVWRMKENKIRSFASIGTGPGIDTIGALFLDEDHNNLEQIVLTDIDPHVLPIAGKNVRRHASDRKVITLEGNLCTPLKKRGIKVDVLYENLPNIPNGNDLDEGFKRSSKYTLGTMQAPSPFQEYLLTSHYAALLDAKNCLNPGGMVVCSIGGRVPYKIIKKMVESAGYEFFELASGYKKQTEPQDVLPGYAAAEKEGSVTFDYYRNVEAAAFVEENRLWINSPTKYSGKTLKENLFRFRISATEALRLYEKDRNYAVGHTVHIIGALKK